MVCCLAVNAESDQFLHKFLSLMKFCKMSHLSVLPTSCIKTLEASVEFIGTHVFDKITVTMSLG